MNLYFIILHHYYVAWIESNFNLYEIKSTALLLLIRTFFTFINFFCHSWYLPSLPLNGLVKYVVCVIEVWSTRAELCKKWMNLKHKKEFACLAKLRTEKKRNLNYMKFKFTICVIVTLHTLQILIF